MEEILNTTAPTMFPTAGAPGNDSFFEYEWWQYAIIPFVAVRNNICRGNLLVFWWTSTCHVLLCLLD